MAAIIFIPGGEKKSAYLDDSLRKIKINLWHGIVCPNQITSSRQQMLTYRIWEFSILTFLKSSFKIFAFLSMMVKYFTS